MENSNEVRVTDFMHRYKAKDDANGGIVSTIVSSLRGTLISLIYRLNYVMIDYCNVLKSIEMRSGEDCSSVLDTNHDKLHRLKSKMSNHLKRYINFVEMIDRLPAIKVVKDMIQRTIISDDLLPWVVSFILGQEENGLPQPAPLSEDESTRSRLDELSLDLSREGLTAIDSLEGFSFDQYAESMGNVIPTVVDYTGTDLDQAAIYQPQRLNQGTQDIASHPDDTEVDFCSDLYPPRPLLPNTQMTPPPPPPPPPPPRASPERLNELEGSLGNELQTTGLLPLPDVSEFIKTLLGLSHEETFRVLTEYQRGLDAATLNDKALLYELLQDSAWLQTSTPMLYMSWVDFGTYDLTLESLQPIFIAIKRSLRARYWFFLGCDWKFTDIIHFLLFTFACKTYLLMTSCEQPFVPIGLKRGHV